MRRASWGRVLRRLVDQRVLDGDLAVEGRLAIADASRSNGVGMVLVDGRPVLVLKRPDVAVDGVDPLHAETVAYRWLAERGLAGLAPRLEAVVDDTLVLEHLGDAVTFDRAMATAGEVGGAGLLVGLGRALGVLHATRSGAGRLPRRHPWVLDLRSGLVPSVLDGDAEIAKIATEISRSEAIVACLDMFAGDGPWDVPVHGDVKFDNVMVTSEAGPSGRAGGSGQAGRSGRADGSGEGATIRLVDWELAGLGNPAWDLAGIVAGLVCPALMEQPPEVALATARRAAPALEAHRALCPDMVPTGAVATATVARLTQSTVQLCAMRHDAPEAAECVSRVLAGAEMLASWVLGGPDGRVLPPGRPLPRELATCRL